MNTVGLHSLFYAEVRKNLLISLRYPLQPVVGLVILLVLFTGISFGIAKYPTLELFEGGDKRVLVASFFCWIVAMGAIGHIGTELEEDIKVGLVEPVFLSRHAASHVILVRSLASSVSGLLMSFLILALLAWHTGASLNLGISSLLALILVDLSLSGIGLIMAGIVILFKRAASVAPLLYMGFGVLIANRIALKADDAMLRYPITSSVEVFTRTLFGTDIPAAALGMAIGWALATLALGIVVLRLCISRARRAGSLSHY